jgi:hypothetical protein
MPDKKDPWAQYEVQPQANDKWSQYEETPQVQPSTFQNIQQQFDQQTAPNPHDNPVEAVGRRAIKAILAPVAHPVQTGQSILDSIPSNPDVSNIQPTNPIVGRGEEFVNDYEKSPATAFENLGGDAIGGLVYGKMFGGPEKPGLPSLVSPVEDTARTAATRAPVPNPGTFEKSIATVGPDIKRFARESGQPIDQNNSTFQRDPNYIRTLSKVADKYGDQLGAHYDTLRDNASKQGGVNVAGPGQPYKEVSVNALQDMAEKLNTKVDDAMSITDRAERRKALDDLESKGVLGERARVADLLNKTIGDRNGLPSQEISDFRQRISGARNIANQANVADLNLAESEGARARGENPAGGTGRSIGGTVVRLGAKALKGDERVAAGRYLSKAMQDLPEANTPLPKPGSPTTVSPTPRQPVQSLPSIDNSQPSMPTADPAAANALRDRLSAKKLQDASATITNQNSAMQHFLHSTNLEQAAQDAAAARSEVAGAARAKNANAGLQQQVDQRAASLAQGDRLRRGLPPLQ